MSYDEHLISVAGGDGEDVREAQAMAQEPGLSEWEIATRRAIHECRLQLTDGTYNVHNILHILEKAAA